MKLKPGCLAEVLSPTADGPYTNLGRIVTAVRLATAEDEVGYINTEGIPCWLVEAPGMHLFNKYGAHVRTADKRIFWARSLRPISDPDVPVGETIAEILKAPLPVEA